MEFEALYIVRTAKYLEDMSNAYGRGDYRLTVTSSQLSVENTAKAVIPIFQSRWPISILLESFTDFMGVAEGAKGFIEREDRSEGRFDGGFYEKLWWVALHGG